MYGCFRDPNIEEVCCVLCKLSNNLLRGACRFCGVPTQSLRLVCRGCSVLGVRKRRSILRSRGLLL